MYHFSRRPPSAPLPNHLCCCNATIRPGGTHGETSLQVRGNRNCGEEGARLQYGTVYG